MPSMQKLQLIGHLGGDPEIRFIGSGQAVCHFSVATTEKWKDKSSGEKKERTEWHRCEVWGSSAERAKEWLYKGCLVYLEGKLQTDKWTDRDGVERYTTKVRVFQWDVLSPRADTTPRRESTQRAESRSEAPSDEKLEDDIPF